MIPCTTCLISTPTAGVNLGDWSHLSISISNPGQVAACAIGATLGVLNFVPGVDLPDILVETLFLSELTAYCVGGA